MLDSAQGDIVRLEVGVAAIDQAHDLEKQWRNLEAIWQPNVFLSWLWIGTWLNCQQPDGLLVNVRDGETLVALGVFGRIRDKALLHQTGIEAQDQVWIEYNGLIAEPELGTPALLAVVRTLLSKKECSVLHLSMLPSAVGIALLASLPHARVYQRVVGWQRDLLALRSKGQTILDALSSNTRQQVRRSLRRYEGRYGTVSVQRVSTPLDAIAALREAGTWHRSRWPDSGFRNPAFIEFHETLLKRGLDHGQVRVYRVAFGDITIGVFYYLCDRHAVRFYLQGVRPEADGKLKPGLTAHCLLMQHFLDEGWDSYDFMGGDSQYKRQLADEHTEFLTLRVHNGGLSHRLADAARAIRDRLSKDESA